MKAMLCILVLLVLIVFGLGCGGSGGDTNEEAGSNPSYYVCSHNGDLLLCPLEGGGDCIRDQSSVEEGSQVDSARVYQVREVEGKPRFFAKLNSGAITIIAECGAVVNLSNSEETTTEANPSTTTTNANTNIGVNSLTPEEQ